MTWAKWGIFFAGLFTVSQFSFWGNYLPRMYPTYLRGTGESFAANVGGRMIGTYAAWITPKLATSMPGGAPARQLAYAAALVALVVYVGGVITSFWLQRAEAGRAAGVAGQHLHQTMTRTAIGIFAALALTGTIAPGAVTTTQRSAERPAVDFKGRLYRAVFVPGPDVLSSGDIAQVAEPLRARLSRFLVRRTSFTSTYQAAPTDVQSVARDAKRRAIERAIVSLIEADGVEKLAVEFVTTAPIADEWEGMPEGPLAESAFAEQLLQKEPSTPLAPYLFLFIAHRQRAASEAAELNQNAAVAQAATAKAREFLQKARGAADPIFGLVADDLERLPFVYVRKKPVAE